MRISRQRQPTLVLRLRNYEQRSLLGKKTCDANGEEACIYPTSWARLTACCSEERRQYCRTEITRLTDRRGDIEAQMVEIVTNAQRMVGDLEDMMLAGYEGRENDAATALEKVIIHQHGS